MASSVSGKVAFVTGGASGIGAALTTKLVDEGAEVWIADRQIGSAQELAQRLNSGAGKAHAIELDVRNYPSFERAVAEACSNRGGSTSGTTAGSSAHVKWNPPPPDRCVAYGQAHRFKRHVGPVRWVILPPGMQ